MGKTLADRLLGVDIRIVRLSEKSDETAKRLEDLSAEFEAIEHHVKAHVGAVGVLKALADYLISPYLHADSEQEANRVKAKRRIIDEAIEGMEALG